MAQILGVWDMEAQFITKKIDILEDIEEIIKIPQSEQLNELFLIKQEKCLLLLELEGLSEKYYVKKLVEFGTKFNLCIEKREESIAFTAAAEGTEECIDVT
jgi:hypothetical protein